MIYIRNTQIPDSLGVKEEITQEEFDSFEPFIQSYYILKSLMQ